MSAHSHHVRAIATQGMTTRDEGTVVLAVFQAQGAIDAGAEDPHGLGRGAADGAGHGGGGLF